MSDANPTDPIRSNPPVQSKFDRSHGKGLKPPHLSWPGAVAPQTGTTVAGHNANGAKYPREGGDKPKPLGSHRHGG